MPRATVVVVSHNSGGHLARSLAALAAQSEPDFEALVFDCDSRDGSFDAARAAIADPRFEFVALGANLGFAAANNIGFARARAKLVATLNPDAFPEIDWLATLLATAAAHPEASALGSTQLRADDPAILDGCGDVYGAGGFAWRGGFGAPASALPAPGEVFSTCAAATLYRIEAVREVGGFDESYFCYVEDVDLGFRLRLAGGACRQVPQAVVRHVGGGSSAASGAAFAQYHGLRNSMWTFVKNMPGPLLVLLTPWHTALLAAAWASLLRRRMGGVAVRAIFDGLRGLPRVWRARRIVQRNRRVDWPIVARWLEWSPKAMLSTRPKTFAVNSPISGRSTDFPR